MKKILLFLFISALLFGISAQVFADPLTSSGGDNSACTADGCKLEDPLGFNGDTQAVQKLIGKVIKSVLGVVGSLALLMFIYGGFTWMTAAGDSGKVTKGRDTLVWAVIGLVVVFSAYAMRKSNAQVMS